MDFRGLRYFEAVARTGSVRVASEQLHIAGSAISRAIGNIEQAVGTVLFDRTHRGMALTTAGEIYLRHARTVLLEQERLKEELDELRGLRSGHIRVVSIEGIVADFTMAAFAEFRKSRPGVTMELRVFGADLVGEALGKREADIGLGANPIASKGNPLKAVLRLSTPLLAAVAPGHALTRLTRAPLAAVVSKYEIAVPDETFAIRRQLEECAKRSGVVLKPALVTNSVDGLRSFARLGAGVTFLPFLAMRDDIERRRLHGIPMSDSILRDATVEVIVAAGRALSPASTAFLRFLEQTGQRLARGETHVTRRGTASLR